jgi:type VI protein secretion system component Hcp
MTGEEHQELKDDLDEDLDLSSEVETDDVRGGDGKANMRVDIHDLTITKRIDKSTPTL